MYSGLVHESLLLRVGTCIIKMSDDTENSCTFDRGDLTFRLPCVCLSVFMTVFVSVLVTFFLNIVRLCATVSSG